LRMNLIREIVKVTIDEYYRFISQICILIIYVIYLIYLFIIIQLSNFECAF